MHGQNRSTDIHTDGDCNEPAVTDAFGDRGLKNGKVRPDWFSHSQSQVFFPQSQVFFTRSHGETCAVLLTRVGTIGVVLPSHCRVEELALPTRAIQLSGEVLSTDEAASAELREAEAVHWTHSSRHLFKAVPTTPYVCREQQLETGLSNKHLKHMLELLLHCGGPAEPRLLCTAVPHTAVVVWTGTTGTQPAHNMEVLEC